MTPLLAKVKCRLKKEWSLKIKEKYLTYSWRKLLCVHQVIDRVTKLRRLKTHCNLRIFYQMAIARASKIYCWNLCIVVYKYLPWYLWHYMEHIKATLTVQICLLLPQFFFVWKWSQQKFTLVFSCLNYLIFLKSANFAPPPQKKMVIWVYT